MIKPKIVVSTCLGFGATRYDGAMLDNAFVRTMREKELIDFATVCPEVGIGLGVPRDTLRLVLKEGKKHLIQPKTGKDVTQLMIDFTNSLTKDLTVDGFIFKADSPSVGTDNVKVYPSEDAAIGKRGGGGLFTSLIIDRFPNYPVESDRRLQNINIQHSFLKKIYTLARFREQVREDSFAKFQQFHNQNYFLLQAHNPELFKKLDEIIVSQKDSESQQITNDYLKLLLQLLKNGNKREDLLYAFNNMFTLLSNELSNKNKEFFRKKITLFEQNLIGESTVLSILENWVINSENDFLINQTIFHPYPLEIMKLEDPYQRRFLVSAYDLDLLDD